MIAVWEFAPDLYRYLREVVQFLHVRWSSGEISLDSLSEDKDYIRDNFISKTAEEEYWYRFDCWYHCFAWPDFVA